MEVLMRVEQEQKVTEDARLFAEQEAASQRQAVNALQEKYEEAMSLLAQMEDRAVMAETMLEATLQYQSSQLKALSSPRFEPFDPSETKCQKLLEGLNCGKKGNPSHLCFPHEENREGAVRRWRRREGEEEEAAAWVEEEEGRRGKALRLRLRLRCGREKERKEKGKRGEQAAAHRLYCLSMCIFIR
ncbi:hypothetical protein GW17_00051817 [Ensete ventricosum]|nr:hypothetical protein GW17_00051817 [Ensete ventricosum]